MFNIKYPGVNVKLIGTDGNAFSILGRVQKELREAHVPADKIDRFLKEAMSGDYDHLLATCQRWVNVQ